MWVVLGWQTTTLACNVTFPLTFTYVSPGKSPYKVRSDSSDQAFPFDPNPSWERFYASGGDILAYIKATVKKWNLDRDLQLNTRVIGAQWQDDLAQWKVTVEHAGSQRDEYCHVLISAKGVLV